MINYRAIYKQPPPTWELPIQHQGKPSAHLPNKSAHVAHSSGSYYWLCASCRLMAGQCGSASCMSVASQYKERGCRVCGSGWFGWPCTNSAMDLHVTHLWRGGKIAAAALQRILKHCQKHLQCPASKVCTRCAACDDDGGNIKGMAKQTRQVPHTQRTPQHQLQPRPCLHQPS